MKTKYINKKVSANGGIVPILNKLKEKGIPQLIRDCLGERPKQSSYSYEDIITSWIATMYCHGFRLLRMEDTKLDLGCLGNLKLPSHDTIGRVMKKLATPTKHIEYLNPKNVYSGLGTKSYKVCEHIKLNDLLIKATKKIGVLKSGVSYTMDIDATILETEVKDADFTYKKNKGFTPMVCMIDKTPVFISMRSGNTSPYYEKLQCIKDALSLLNSNGIKVDRIRIDGAGYQNKIIDYLNSIGIEFVISARFTNKTKQVAANHRKWTSSMYSLSNNVIIPVQTASRTFKMKKDNTSYRMVVMRMENHIADDIPTNWKQIKKHCYRFIITNDKEAEEIDIFYEYKQRGAIEQNFSSLKNDFGWRIMPFSKMNENLVYMILTALSSNIYQGILKVISKKSSAIKKTMQLRTFKKIFINVILIIENDTYIFCGGSGKIDYEKIS